MKVTLHSALCQPYEIGAGQPLTNSAKEEDGTLVFDSVLVGPQVQQLPTESKLKVYGHFTYQKERNIQFEDADEDKNLRVGLSKNEHGYGTLTVTNPGPSDEGDTVVEIPLGDVSATDEAFFADAAKRLPKDNASVWCLNREHHGQVGTMVQFGDVAIEVKDKAINILRR